MKTGEVNGKRPIGLLSIDTSTLYKRLVAAPVGETIPYEELSKLIGRDIRQSANWILRSALRKALSSDSMVFAAVRNIGIKRLSDHEIVENGMDPIARAHGLATRGARKLAAVEYEKLEQQDRVRFDTQISLLAAIGHITKDKQIKKLETVVQSQQARLPLQKTLEAFKS